MRKSRIGTSVCAGMMIAGLAGSAMAGGGPENVLVIINPANAESMYLGHYYQQARNIPASNVLYIDPAATNYAALVGVNGNIDGVLGKLANSRLTDHIDYIVIASGQAFYVDAPGLVSDGCSPVNRFSLTSAYDSAFIRSQVLTATMASTSTNQFYGTTPIAFDSNQRYLTGAGTTVPTAPRYFITSQLGYTGPRGNTVPEITAMIDSSVAVDGAHPAGTFYFMSTTDTIRNVRSPNFAAAVSSITGAGGLAQILNGIVPDLQSDCLGVMTGWPDPNVEGAIFTLLPGSYCDDLTSYAATFDIADQTKMSSWIRKGAAGVSGTVEEPCNYTGKFAAPNFQAVYFKGMTLGEAYLRSMAFFPFQSMFQGDPVTRPFATIPTVSANAPTGSINGVISFTPTAATTLPGATIQKLELMVNGVVLKSTTPGGAFSLTTWALPDGPNDVRVIAYDSTTVKTVGRSVATLNLNNSGRAVTLNMPVSTGTMSTLFTGTISASGSGKIREVRLIQNGRVLAAAATPGALGVFGRNIGAGKSRVQAEVVYTDNTTAVSPSVLIDVALSAGAPLGQAPVAYGYIKHVQRGQPVVVELPASFDDDVAGATFTLVSNPTQCTVGAGTKGYRVMTAAANACGTDPFTFRVNTPSGQSGVVTVKLIYDSSLTCVADFDGNGSLNANDFNAFLNGYAAQSLTADVNGDCNLNAADFLTFLNAFAVGCP